MPGLNQLVDSIRAKYPGSYDDMDDATLTRQVLAKYPQYSDLTVPKLSQPVQVESSGRDKFLGALAPQAAPRTAGAGLTQEGFPGFEGSYASGDEGKALAMTGAGLATAAAPLIPAVARAAMVAGKWTGAH